MAKAQLAGSTLSLELAKGLNAYLQVPEIEEESILYSYPEIHKLERPAFKKQLYTLKLDSIRLPARINNPLIPYTDNVKEYITTKSEEAAIDIHSHHHSHLKILQDTVAKLPLSDEMRMADMTFDINILKRASFAKYSNRTNLINLATLEFAKRATQHELSITALEDIPFMSTNMRVSSSLSFLILIHRLRAMLARLNETKQSDFDVDLFDSEEAKLTLYKNCTYSYSARGIDYIFCLIVSGGHFRLYHSSMNIWFCGNLTYLDYMFSTADIMNNLDIITNCSEYNWAHPFFDLMRRISSLDCDHNDGVNFMKNLEGFLLNISDYDEDYSMNWRPILDASHSLWELDQRITAEIYDFKIIPALLHNPDLVTSTKSLLQNMISVCRKLERSQVQELSSLHKLIFYAEVDADAGVKKFLKRVHTPRPIEEHAVKNIVRLAKQQFLIAYKKKHSAPPNMLGNAKKIKLLQIKANRSEYSEILSLPLSWWDDVTIFNCMDNKLTNDALEFAKDKGALKKEVRFGPGDSRKELLQVIEQPDYELKDFFQQGTFIPKKPAVFSTRHSCDPFPSNHPVRLIEKEREQKEEARLFANGELSDKHSLSLVTTRMKKALNYFDEQLMTPPDKKRKEIIHLAAQKLRQENMYSLLLDIEGHNQSMQASNTSELSEFCGHLFGEYGWGNLPDYFSALDVYHYHEYTDKVVLSQGQLGGIEGWLNPLWTLHTTLMMKLLRIMTDIEIPDIMVYSDDVNAIIEIPQASEESIRAIFEKIISHCKKFGMIVKFSQTNLSKHRVTMLRQHYSDGVRADSTLKKLISTSGANNPMLVSEEIEVSGICSSIASALELSNHNETCCYLKNYKIGLLVARLPHIILSRQREGSMLSSELLPKSLANLLYNVKDDTSYLIGQQLNISINMIMNDMQKYLQVHIKDLDKPMLRDILINSLGESQTEYKFADSADRLLYLQMHDKFLQDLLFFWIYIPSTLGGLGGILHINLILSGHSSGFSKSIHYIHQWIKNRAENKDFFYRYLELLLGVDREKERNFDETRILSTAWPSDNTLTTANTSVSQSIESMIRYRTRNKNVKLLMKLKDDKPNLARDFIEIFRNNMHPRVCQFYMENTSGHFLDLLINKIETSSGLLSFIKRLTRLRNSLQVRMMENILLSSRTTKGTYGEINAETDTVEYLMLRRSDMFRKIRFIEVDEILYDNRMELVPGYPHLLTVRKCTPMHYENGIKVYDTPQVGNEARYKGEFMDDDRMIGNKEEFLAAKLVAVTKWFLTKADISNMAMDIEEKYDCVIACNLSLRTLTGQTFQELKKYSPNETGGEILHRIPNIRFSTMTYIRSEMNRSLTYTTDLNQREINNLYLSDSNINFDYLRLRFQLAAMIKDKYPRQQSFISRFMIKNLTGIMDVQFVTPKLVDHMVTNQYITYGSMRGHNFSLLKFRYMVNAYLSIDEIKDISSIPTLEEGSSSRVIEVDMIDDLIYHYAKELDREYMSILPTYIDGNLWRPLMEKLERLTPNLKSMTSGEWLNYLSQHLTDSLNKRRLITVVSKSDTLRLSLQNQCIESIKLYYPNDIEFGELIDKYRRLLGQNLPNRSLQTKIIRYQTQLKSLDFHRMKLGIAMICEYIITLNFITKVEDGVLSFDPENALKESRKMDLFHMSMLMLVPDLQVKAMILGIDYINQLMFSRYTEITDILKEISEDNLMIDLIAPGSLPNLTPITTLDGAEEIIEASKESEYDMVQIPETAMEKFDELKPLCKFATKCVINGSHPSVFTSPTGSDSFSAQYGLFRMLKNRLGLNEKTKICDLTGGRGDFQYVCRELGLIADTYSKKDAFTRVMHHPGVIFEKEYDLRRTATIKFVTEYQFIHIDVSFIGQKELNILDVILFLESNNLAYSIRINSINLIGYIQDSLADIPEYTHNLAFSTSRDMKAYQFYLVGLPGTPDNDYNALSMKKTVAFRSVALSYARLLSPLNRRLRLHDYEPNSLSLYFGNNETTVEIISQIADRSYEKERLYYSSRYLSELEDDEALYWVAANLDKRDSEVLNEYKTNFIDYVGTAYDDEVIDSIGNVSNKSLPYHIKHLIALQDIGVKKVKAEYGKVHDHVLEYMRIHHPIQEVRSKCNIMLGLKKFNYYDFLSGRKAIQASVRESKWSIGPRDTLHQIEVQNAIKLLIISASRDNYMHGINYLSSMLSSNSQIKQSYMRVLKSYRLLSTHYELIRSLLFSGAITLKQLDAMKHDLEVKETRKLKYTVDKVVKLEEYFLPEDDGKILDESLSHLFDSLLSWSERKIEIIPGSSDIAMVDVGPTGLNMQFNLDIDQQVNSMLIRLGLSEPNEFGWIDLYDEEPPDNWEEI